ncbi:prolipoprotein diacylglyceryl transferase [Lacticigenium naphthae]|uniref:prolipoprotein diacylglyceryl transferase n=1 Tax=Lacticigenium naphthae TaxID=515351 RepID=UPI00041D849E|nr:prolipoprotein diacylglyceryl transferase [Lacticigenium naphthae]
MQTILGAIDPTAFTLGPLSVQWYGVIIALGIFLAVWLSIREAEKLGLEEDSIIDLALWIIPFGFVGARLYYVIFELDYYLQNPSSILAIWEGGIAIYGGLIAGFITLLVYSKKKNYSPWLIVDILAPHVLLAQAIGRWGNFINQEAHGGEVTRDFLESIFLPEFIIDQMNINGTYYHPTFLYESLWSLIGIGLLIVLRNREHFFRRGEVALAYVMWYSFGRFFIEGMRTDSLYFFSTSIRVSQILSVFLFIGAAAIMYYRRTQMYPPVPFYEEKAKK